MGCVGEKPIIAGSEKIPTGNSFLETLYNESVVDQKTELMAVRKDYGITYITKICFQNDKYVCFTGYLLYKEYSNQRIVPLLDENGETLFFESIDAAAKEVELRAYTDVIKRAENGEKHGYRVPDKIPIGYGVPKGKWIVKKSANDKTLEMLYPFIT